MLKLSFCRSVYQINITKNQADGKEYHTHGPDFCCCYDSVILPIDKKHIKEGNSNPHKIGKKEDLTQLAADTEPDIFMAGSQAL